MGRSLMVSVFMVSLLAKVIALERMVSSKLSARVSLMHGLCQIYSRVLIKLPEPCRIRGLRSSSRLCAERWRPLPHDERWRPADRRAPAVGSRTTSTCDADTACRGPFLVCESADRELVSKRHM